MQSNRGRQRIGRTGRQLLLLGVAVCSSVSCVKRELQIRSEPPGALVFLNDQEIGRTPVTRPFTFYGTYDVVLRLEGYETLKAKKLVLAPWWQWVPIDLAAELLPLTDRQRLTFALQPASTQPADPAEMFRRAAEIRGQLPEAEAPTTGPTTRP